MFAKNTKRVPPDMALCSDSMSPKQCGKGLVVFTTRFTIEAVDQDIIKALTTSFITAALGTYEVV